MVLNFQNDFKKALKNRAPCPMDQKTFDEFAAFHRNYGNGPFMSMQEREVYTFKESVHRTDAGQDEDRQQEKEKSPPKGFMARLMA